MTTRDLENNQGCLTRILSFFGFRPTVSRQSLGNLYFKHASVFTPNELAFYKQLKIVIGERFAVLAKVGLPDVFEVKPTSFSQHQSAFNRIRGRHFDFLICEPESFLPRFAIELDDKTHKRSKREQSDKFKDEICNELDLKLIRIPAAMTYSPERIRDLIIDAFQKK